MSLGDQIYKLRKNHNLSQEQLAEKVGVARQTISKWELGETAPDIRQAQILSQIFSVSLDELLGNDTKKFVNSPQDYKEKNNVHWQKIIVISAAVVCLCLVVVGVFSVVKRLQILHPEGVEGNVVITRKDPILIGKGSTDTIVFNEKEKPTIACDLPEGFALDAERPGLYTDGDGNFIRFNADCSENVVNPLLGTDYYSYYEDYGYHSYMDMVKLAMYYDLPKLGVFSSIEELHLAGGAQLIREQLCAGQNADYYAIDGGLTASGERMQIYGFALHFENTTWMITLRDCDDNYYFITIKDPDGIGKTIDAVGEFLSSVSTGNMLEDAKVENSVAIQAARNAFAQYLVDHAVDGKIWEYHYIFQADSSRFVAICDGAVVTRVYSSLENALNAIIDNPDLGKLSATGVDNLWVYGVVSQ